MRHRAIASAFCFIFFFFSCVFCFLFICRWNLLSLVDSAEFLATSLYSLSIHSHSLIFSYLDISNRSLPLFISLQNASPTPRSRFHPTGPRPRQSRQDARLLLRIRERQQRAAILLPIARILYRSLQQEQLPHRGPDQGRHLLLQHADSRRVRQDGRGQV